MTKIKNRKSVRLQSWDYSSDAYYFVTICTQNRESIFGEIVYRKMMLNQYGTIVENVWKSLPNHHNVFLDKHQTMPNHFHGIIICTGVAMNGCTGVARNAPTRNENNIFSKISPKLNSLSVVVRSFKSECTKQIHQINPNLPVWQRNYYEHIIRNEAELIKIQNYIIDNPAMWFRDRNNPDNMKFMNHA